jgi:hypothetical protein
VKTGRKVLPRCFLRMTPLSFRFLHWTSRTACCAELGESSNFLLSKLQLFRFSFFFWVTWMSIFALFSLFQARFSRFCYFSSTFLALSKSEICLLNSITHTSTFIGLGDDFLLSIRMDPLWKWLSNNWEGYPISTLIFSLALASFGKN